MPPSILPCRTCKLVRQAVFIQGVEPNDPDTKTVLYIRAASVVVVGAVVLYFLLT